MHPEAEGWVAECVSRLTFTPRVVIELGARNVNGGVRHLFPTATTYIGVDIGDGPGVDVVADAAEYVSGVPADVIVSTEMLEHTPAGAQIIARCAENLRPGGVLIVTAAGPGRSAHSAVDGGPLREGEWYGNISEDDLVGWLSAAGFASWTIDLRPHPADIRAHAIR